MPPIQRITLIGAGNVATHLGKALKNAGVQVLQVYSKTIEKARILSNLLEGQPIDDLTQISRDTDAIFMLVKDAMMPGVLEKFRAGNCLLVHASGSVEMDVLKPYAVSYGVFYPLQTFSTERDLFFGEIPLCIEASSEENLHLLMDLAHKLSNDVRQINSRERLIIHIAAVFACNFTNYMFAIAEELLKRYELPFDIMKPLIRETAMKSGFYSPALAQTGPALRNDTEIIEKHLELLKADPKISEIYRMISELIMNRHSLLKKTEIKS